MYLPFGLDLQGTFWKKQHLTILIVQESCKTKPNLVCNYHAPIDLTAAHYTCGKSCRNLVKLTKFGLQLPFGLDLQDGFKEARNILRYLTGILGNQTKARL